MASLREKQHPYLINIDSGSITASSNATDTVSVGSNEEVVIRELRIVSATGTFSLDITDETGRAYNQESVHFATGQTTYYPLKFDPPLQFPPSSEFKFKFTDTSAATNRVRMQLIAVKYYL